MENNIPNNENIFEVLNEFEKKNPKEMTPILEDYLHRIAKTGDTVFPWSKLKPVFLFKLDSVMQELYEKNPTDDLPKCPNVENVKFDVMRRRLLDAVNNFNSAPFTIQRLCEMLTYHRKHYTRTDKFLRGIEKNVLVVSTVQPGSQRSSYENSAMVNGLFSDSSSYNGLDHHTNIIPDLPRQIASSSVTSWPSPDSSGMEQDNSDQGDSADALDGIVCPPLDDDKLNNNPDSGLESESDSDDSGLPSDSLIDNMEASAKEKDDITEEPEAKEECVLKDEVDSMEDIETKESIEETNIDNQENMLESDPPSDNLALLQKSEEVPELNREEEKMSGT